MVHDYARWRDDWPFVLERMVGVRHVIEGMAQFRDEHGLLRTYPDRNYPFVDWVLEWKHGSPKVNPPGTTSILNLQYILTLEMIAELETWAGEPELAARMHRMAQEHMERTIAHFWDTERGLFADGMDHASYSEHAQALALLTHSLNIERRNILAQRIIAQPDLTRTALYFTHYLFEAYARIGAAIQLQDRLEPWYRMPQQGLFTTPESDDTIRSDCHNWTTHPLYHYLASIAGIRPAAQGFAEVRIAPLLGRLTTVAAQMPHPKGMISLRLSCHKQNVTAEIELPAETPGIFVWNGREYALRPGKQRISIS
jgi:hypothetical protein